MAESLSQEEVSEYKEAFSQFDTDGDGIISVNDLDALLRKLSQTVGELELQDMINEVDQDCSGLISFPQFLTLMARKMQDTDAEEVLKEVFRVLDKENRGFVAIADMKHA